MTTLCGADCNECWSKKDCKGCVETSGHPHGGPCVAAECIKKCGQEGFQAYMQQTISEFNALNVKDMPQITKLTELIGSFVNLEYSMPNGGTVKLLDDTKIYLGYQVGKQGSDRCFGLVADEDFLVVCEYGCNGADPELVVYKKR